MNTPTLDLSYLHSISGGNAAFEKTLLTSAIVDIQQNIDSLKKAWQEQNPSAIANAAHTLKSVMVIAGLPELENACKATDIAFRDGQFHPEIFSTVARITDGWAAAKPKLEALVAVY